MLLSLLHECKRPLLGRHLRDLSGQQVVTALVRRTLFGVRRAADISVDRRLQESRVSDSFDCCLDLRRGEGVRPVSGWVLRTNVLDRRGIRLRILLSLDTVGIVLQTAKDVLEELLASPRIERMDGEAARECPVVDVYGAQVCEDGTGPVGVSGQNRLRGLVIDGFQARSEGESFLPSCRATRESRMVRISTRAGASPEDVVQHQTPHHRAIHQAHEHRRAAQILGLP